MIAVSKGTKFVWGVAMVLALVGGLATRGVAQGTGSVSGQFRVGDRIALTVESPMAIRDTFAVREGLFITIPNVGDISLKGVRRADTQKYLTQQLKTYMRDPVVKAVALVRIGILGPVARPNYYVVPSDAIVSDVFQFAGGLTQVADPNRTIIRRSGREIVGHGEVSSAITAGRTLDDLGIMPGDEVVVGEADRRDVRTYLQFASLLLGITVAVVSLSRHH